MSSGDRMPKDSPEDIAATLMRAIRDARRVRLAYRRSSDEVVTLHDVAPVDIRSGERRGTENTVYVWAWCFAEDELEMHVLQRIEKVVDLDERFSPQQILSRWPKDRWPIPESWSVPRQWGDA